MSELSKLFKRVDIEIHNHLNNNKDLNEAVDSFEVAFEDGLHDQNKTTQALKRLIQERNLVSHYAHIDTFQSLPILLEWIKYYKLLGHILSKAVCLEFVKTVDKNKKNIGHCKKVLRNILLIDIDKDIEIDQNTKLYVYSDGNLIDIVIPQSFRIDGIEVTIISGISRAGIMVDSMFAHVTKVKSEYNYFIIEGV